MKIRKMQNGGYPANVQELLRGLESDLRPSSLAPVPRDPDIETNRRRRVDGPYNLPKAYGYEELMRMTAPADVVIPAGDTIPQESYRPRGSVEIVNPYVSPTERARQAVADVEIPYAFGPYGAARGTVRLGDAVDVATDFIPGVGDAKELNRVMGDLQDGSYSEAGLGALLMLLPGALGKYIGPAYQKFRALLPDRKRTEAIDDLMKNYMTRENKFQRQMRQDEERILRQNFGEDMEEARRGFQQVDNLRTAAPINDIMEISSDPAMLREYGRLLDPDVPYTEKRKILDRFGADDISVDDAVENIRQNFDQIETLTGDYSGIEYSDIPQDILGLAAGRRGGMPLEEFYRRVAGNPVPGMPLTADQIKQIEGMFDRNYYDSVMSRVADYYEKTGKNPNMEEMLELIQSVRRQDMGITSQDLLKPQFRNEKGGKIPYKVIKR